MSDTIYISRKCEHCHELLILLHKNKDILKFPVIDVHTKPYPKTVTSVPCMIIDGKVLPGQELFKFLNYLIQKNNTNNNQTNNNTNDLMPNENNNPMQNNPMQNTMQNNPMQGNPMQNNMPMQNNIPGAMKNLNVPGNTENIQKDNINSEDDDLPGFCIGGSCELGFCNIDNETDISMDNSYEILNESDGITPQMDDGSTKSEKAKQVDDDYSRLMQERGNDMMKPN